jgi:hypothetical protein
MAPPSKATPSETRKMGNKGDWQPDERGRSPMYIGIGTVLLILVIVLLIAFVF